MKNERFDVLIAGGGPAGVAAAVSASRAGAKVLLVDKAGGLGGNVRAAHVHSICGLYDLHGDPAHGGFAAEFARRLVKHGMANGPQRFGRVHVLLHDPGGFAGLCEEMVRAARGVEFRVGCEIISGGIHEEKIVSVSLRANGITETVQVGAVVEATGDGSLAAAAGLGFEISPAKQLQRPAYIFGLSPVEGEGLSAEVRLETAAQVHEAIREGRLGEEARGFVVRPSGFTGLVRVTLDLSAGGENYDPLDSTQVDQWTSVAQTTAESLTDFFRENVAAFARAEIVSRPLRIGIRESRRVSGRTVLDQTALLNGDRPADTIVNSAWPLEIHEDGKSVRLVFPQTERGVAGIPLRALQSRDAGNVFLAGRCISCSHEAQAAVRVIATSFATGQAAGLAAAAAAAGVEKLPSEIFKKCMA